jgi:tRNA(Ile)-lysidine synthase
MGITALERKLRASWRRLQISPLAPIIVAVSGGPDSTALFDALMRRGARLHVAHFNHELRGDESDGDESFVRALATGRDLGLTVGRASTAEAARRTRRNLEAVAREQRYQFLLATAQAQGAQWVLTGHTRDDQVETILQRLLRGTGPEGWRGIHEVLALDDEVRLARPLLGVTREDVLAHCSQYRLVFRQDTSNLSDRFTRNRVRNELLPLLRTFNPRVDQALLRAARLLAEDEEYFRVTVAELVRGAREGASLDVRGFAALPRALRRRALRQWLREERGDLLRVTGAHLGSLERLATESEGGRYVELPGHWRVERRAGRIRLIHQADAAATIDGAEASKPTWPVAEENRERKRKK